MFPRVAVIVLAYNGVDLTLNCLTSLRRSDYANTEVIVVDNASTDNTVAEVRLAFPEAHLIEAGDNLGYAAGNNLGLQAALARGAQRVFLVNNDTTLEHDCISRLVEAIERRPGVGAIGPLVYTWDEGHIISSAGGMIDWAHADAYNAGAGEQDRGQFPARQVDYSNGCGLMVTRAAVEAAGLLDARYFMYWEETDWCLRARAAGFEVQFEPSVWMRHKAPIHHRDLGPTTLYYVTRNRWLFFPPASAPGRPGAGASRRRGDARHCWTSPRWPRRPCSGDVASVGGRLAGPLGPRQSLAWEGNSWQPKFWSPAALVSSVRTSSMISWRWATKSSAWTT
jgi:hypothetical protein